MKAFLQMCISVCVHLMLKSLMEILVLQSKIQNFRKTFKVYHNMVSMLPMSSPITPPAHVDLSLVLQGFNVITSMAIDTLLLHHLNIDFPFLFSTYHALGPKYIPTFLIYTYFYKDTNYIKGSPYHSMTSS